MFNSDFITIASSASILCNVFTFSENSQFRLFPRIFNSGTKKCRNVRGFSLKKKIIERFESGYECDCFN